MSWPAARCFQRHPVAAAASCSLQHALPQLPGGATTRRVYPANAPYESSLLLPPPGVPPLHLYRLILGILHKAARVDHNGVRLQAGLTGHVSSSTTAAARQPAGDSRHRRRAAAAATRLVLCVCDLET